MIAFNYHIFYRDDESGQYREKYPFEDFLQTLHELGAEVGTKELEEAVGCEYRTAIAKLNELDERGFVTNRRVGNADLWSLANPETMDQREAGNDDTASLEDHVYSLLRSDPYDPSREEG